MALSNAAEAEMVEFAKLFDDRFPPSSTGLPASAMDRADEARAERPEPSLALFADDSAQTLTAR